MCEKEDCEKELNNCIFRHPRSCSFFEKFTRCKFGDFCSYKHLKTNTVKEDIKILREENDEMKIKITEIEELINGKDKEIQYLYAKIEEISAKVNDISLNASNREVDLEKQNDKQVTENEVLEIVGVDNDEVHGKFTCEKFDRIEIFESSGNIPQLDGLIEQRNFTSYRKEESMGLNMILAFRCDMCNYSSSHDDLLRRHINKKHNRNKKKKTKNNES